LYILYERSSAKPDQTLVQRPSFIKALHASFPAIVHITLV